MFTTLNFEIMLNPSERMDVQQKVCRENSCYEHMQNSNKDIREVYILEQDTKKRKTTFFKVVANGSDATTSI